MNRKLCADCGLPILPSDEVRLTVHRNHVHDQALTCIHRLKLRVEELERELADAAEDIRDHDPLTLWG